MAQGAGIRVDAARCTAQAVDVAEHLELPTSQRMERMDDSKSPPDRSYEP